MKIAIKDFDDMFHYVGGYGRYQKILVFVSCYFNMIYAYIYFGQIFMTPTPDHWCHVPELGHLPLEQRRRFSIPKEIYEGRERHSHCRMYDVNYTDVLLAVENNVSWDSLFGPNSSVPVTSCRNGWEYDHSVYYDSVVSEFNWVCAEDWRASAAQTVCFVGSMLGTLFFGFAADTWGRLPVLVASNLLACFSTLATAFIQDFSLFMVCRFITGLSIDTFYTMIYILVQEYVLTEKRSVASNVPIAIFLTIGMVTLPWVAYAIWNWRILAIVIACPFAAAGLAPWFVPESGRWLLSKGKVDKAEAILRRVAEVNKKTVPEAAFAQFRTVAEKLAQEERKQNRSFRDLFRTPVLRRNVITMIVVWMMTSVCYDGHVRNIDNLQYSLYTTFTIAGSLELPADLVMILLMDTLGRRWTTASTLLLSGVVYLIAAFLVNGNPMPIACLAMVGRFFITMTLNVTLQYTMEIVPTNLRGQGSSLIHITGHVANSCVPYIVYLGTQSAILPFLILGIASAFGGCMSLLLPETADEPLPTTVAEAELFGRGQSIWELPRTKKRKRSERLSRNRDDACDSEHGGDDAGDQHCHNELLHSKPNGTNEHNGENSTEDNTAKESQIPLSGIEECD